MGNISTGLKAIPTHFAGNYFRSRLEARWATFYQELGIVYEYEREGYDLDGVPYLPDFWLPKQDCFVEIKGETPSKEEEDKATRLSVASGKNVYIFWGQIPVLGMPPIRCDDDNDSSWAYFPNRSIDYQYVWCECPVCDRLEVTYQGRTDRLHCNHGSHIEHNANANAMNLIVAYFNAREARFEYGDAR